MDGKKSDHLSDNESDHLSDKDDEEFSGDGVGSDEEDDDSLEEMKEFLPENDQLSFVPLQIADGECLRVWERSYCKAEEDYAKRLKMDAVTDSDLSGYSDQILQNLTKISYYLRVRRRRRYFRLLASQFKLNLMDTIDEFGICAEFLRRESNEVQALLAEEQIQIRSSADLDVALFLIKGNSDVDKLPVFLFATVDIFNIVNRLSLGRFRYIVRRTTQFDMNSYTMICDWGYVMGDMHEAGNPPGDPDWEEEAAPGDLDLEEEAAAGSEEEVAAGSEEEAIGSGEGNGGDNGSTKDC